MSERLVFMRRASGLVRELTVTDVIIWCIASPTASGLLYYQVATASEYPGANPILSFLIGGIIVFPIVFTLATMMRIMPRAGGMYVCISRLVDPSVAYVTGAVYALSLGMTVGIMSWVGTGVLGSCMTLGGHAGKVPGLVAAGEWLGQNTGRTIVSLIFVLLFWLTSLLSLRAAKFVMRASFVLALGATVVLMISGLVTPDGSSAFERTWGPGVYQAIIDAARANGWQPPEFSWSSTIGLLLVVFWAYSAFEYIAAMAGEVKTPQRSMFRGMIGGFACTVLLYMIVAWLSWRPFQAASFIPAYTYLYDNYPDVLKSIMPLSRPSVPLFLGSLLPSPWLAILVMLLSSLWFYNTAFPSLVTGARVLFAMSFDRQLPKSFAAVSKRGVPTTCTHIMCVIGLLTVFLNLYGVQVLLGLADVAGYFPFWAFGLSAVMLPYKRPDIYGLSPVQGEFLGVPWISWMGALTTALGWFLVAFAISPLGTAVQAMFAVAVLVMTAVYIWAQQRNVKEGVDVGAIYSEIPPE